MEEPIENINYTIVALADNGQLKYSVGFKDDAQKIADHFMKDGFRPKTILLFRNGDVSPLLQSRYERGRDFSERIESIDSVVDTIKTWIDGLDNEGVLKLLTQVTGAQNVRVISREGDNVLVGYDLP